MHACAGRAMGLLHLLLLMQVLFSPVPIQSQCVQPTQEVIENLLLTHLMKDAGGPLDLELAQYAISCLSSGGIRNMYNQASIIVNFLSNITIESCPPSPTGCKGFFHIVCADNAPLWILDEVAPPSILQLNNEADIDIGEPRTDCGACTYLGLFPPNFSDLYDADTHCYVCDCDGQGLCVGLQECCSFFDGDNCTSDCGKDKFAGEETDFICVCRNRSLAHPDCKDNCEGHLCQNGNCVDQVGSYMCDCDNGYEGEFCEDDINECAEVDCNNGTCIDQVNGFTCDCDDDYEGKFCENRKNGCLNVTCQNGGTCVDLVHNFTCNCLDGIGGQFCEEDVFNDCDSDPCKNGGCIDQLLGHTCECKPGFTGDACEIHVHVATDNCSLGVTCLNGGKCVRGIDKDFCICAANFHGNNCESCVLHNCVVCSTSQPRVCDQCEDSYITDNYTGQCVQVISSSTCTGTTTAWLGATIGCIIGLIVVILMAVAVALLLHRSGKLGSCMYICSKVKSDDKSFGLKCRASQFVAPVNNDYEINTNLKNFAEMKKNSV